MNKEEVMAILNSDMKLWERATTQEGKNGSLTKTLDLPWGIGEFSVTIEGVTDAQRRRAAVAGFAEAVRAEVSERIDDEAVTARAKQAAAKASYDTSDVSNGGGDDSARPGRAAAEGSAQVADKETVAASNVLTTRPETAASQRVALVGRIERLQDDLDAARLELKALEAYLSVIGEVPAPDSDAEDGSEDDQD